MEAAHIAWRPLGQLFVERGLITQDELEDALVEQQDTRKRLGAILVARGLVSGPELTSVLVDQLGMELTKESGFGSGLWDEIRRRHQRGGRSATEGEASENGGHHPREAAGADEHERERAEIVAADARERAAFAVAEDEERAELEAALSAERMALEKTLADERAAKQEALAELAEARTEASARTAELGDLSTQVADLRRQIQASTAAVAVVAKAGTLRTIPEPERTAELESRLAEVEAELAHARGEARNEATELRAAIDRLRGEIDDLDAATAWFEYWSGAAAPATTPTSRPPAT